MTLFPYIPRTIIVHVSGKKYNRSKTLKCIVVIRYAPLRKKNKKHCREKKSARFIILKSTLKNFLIHKNHKNTKTPVCGPVLEDK